MFLHGNNSQGSDGFSHLPLDSLLTALSSDRDRFPALIVFPQAREGTRWSTPAMQDLVLAQLDAVMKDFNGDRSRIYLTGHSMGGGGVIRMATRVPDRFAALVDISGRVSVNSAGREQRLIDEDLHAHPYLEAPDLFHAAANAIRGLPIWVFHSATDKVVPVEESRRLVSALKEIDADVRYTEYKDLDHNATNRQAWSEKSLSHWLFAQRRLSSTHKPTTKPE